MDPRKTSRDERSFVLFTGYSMHPSLRPGDRLFVRPAGPGELEPGDVVLFEDGPRGLTAHRLVKLLPGGRGVTKGDSLLEPDPGALDLAMIRGRVDAVLRGKRVISLTSGPRAGLRRALARLSIANLTPGAMKQRVKPFFRPPSRAHTHLEKDKEREFILSAVAGSRVQPPRGLDWPGLVETAKKEQVAGLLHARLKHEDLPAPAKRDLEGFYHATVAANMALLSALEELDEALEHAGISVVALKGASLLEPAYRGLGLRPMGDVDLVVRPEERGALVELLGRLGYERDPVHPHFHVKRRAAIDLHTHALDTDRIRARAALFPAGMGPVWDAAVPLMDGFSRVMRPSDEDNVILLSHHLLKHSFSRLFWLADILMLLSDKKDDFWASLEKRAGELGQVRVLCQVLYLMERLFGLGAPESSMLHGCGAALSPLEKRILDALAEGRDMGLSGNILLMFCLSNMKHRLLFGLETLFPGREVLSQNMGRAGAAGPGVYIRRLSEVASQSLRHGILLIRAMAASR